MAMKASDLFIQCLEEEGCEYIFGVPGEENLDFLDSLSRSTKIKLILTRHEQGAGFMAATYGRHTGKTGVCIATLGPGATNFVTAAAYATLGRDADDDDHRAKADQEIQAGPLSDP
jgi:acetolactate synthase-1/2/3 large subunit